MSLPAPVTVAGFAPLAVVAKTTVTGAVLAALRVMVFWVAVPSATLTGEPMLTTGNRIGVLVVPVQAGAVPVHNGSPPPIAVALLTLGLTAVAATLTGTVITIGPAAPVATVQPAKLVVLEHPLSVPPVAVMLAATVVMPTGKASVKVIGAVVGPFVIAILIVYV
jgi:hypothetical protein